MFAEHIRVNIADFETAVIGNSRTKSRGVDYRARTYYSVFGNARKFAERISEYVYRIGDHDIYRIGRGFGYFGNNGFLYTYISLDKFESRLTGLSRYTRSYYDYIGTLRVFVGACVNAARAVVRKTLTNIEGFAESAVAVDVD